MTPPETPVLSAQARLKLALKRRQHIPRRSPWVAEAPLSSAQQTLWILHELTAHSAAYNTCYEIDLAGPLDAAALARTFDWLVARHEILRTTFHAGRDGQPAFQRVQQRGPTLDSRSLEDLPAEARRAEVDRLTSAFGRTLFNLAQGPLVYACLLRLSPEEHVLSVTMHHIISDGWSTGVLIGELESAYLAFASGREPDLDPPSIQYADFAVWEQQRNKSGGLDPQIEFWKQELAGARAILDLPTDFTRTQGLRFEGELLRFTLPESLSARILDLARTSNTSLFMVLMAAYQILMYRYTGQSEMLIGTPYANRTRREMESMLGCVMTPLAIRGDLSGNPDFLTVLGRVQERALAAFAHPDVPFHRLVEELQPERQGNRPPLFQTMFILQNTAGWHRKSALEMRAREIHNRTAKLDLALSIWPEDGTLTGYIEYNTTLFRRSTIERFCRHWETLLASIADRPERPVAELPLFTAAEENRILKEWNQTEADFPREARLDELMAAQARRTPRATAIVDGERSFSYAALDAAADRLAIRLRKHGIPPGSLIPVCIGRSAELVIAILAVLKAGGAYVPLDPAQPAERNRLIVADTGAQLLLKITGAKIEIVRIRDAGPAVCYPQAGAVIFTSGSTGRPKGVIVAHRSMINHALWSQRHFGLDAGDRVLQFSAVTFDALSEEIYPCLVSGGCIVVRNDAMLGSAAEFNRFLDAHGITRLLLSTVFFEEWVAEMERARLALPGSLRVVAAGGERLSLQALEQWDAVARGSVRFANLYGPTEATVITTCYDHVDAAALAGCVSVPIGKPVSNARVYVLDANRQPVPVGVPGELYIAGECLALGYLNAAGDAFPEVRGERMYRSGDIVRWHPGGVLEFIGRADQQVKLRGYRIELGEIEAALDRCPGVNQSVAAIRGEGAERRIVAYLTGVARDSEALRRELGGRLPAYMLPSAFVFLERLPLNGNGKVDRAALPDTADFEPGGYVAPRSALERALCGIWARGLRLERVGIHDNFFDLGGHSLKAAQVMHRVRDLTGQQLPLATLFDAPTVEQLARLLERKQPHRAAPALARVQRRGVRRPLFCVHSDPLFPFRFNRLAAHLGPEQPLFAIEPRALDGGRILKIPEIAAIAIRAMRAAQPEGPYALAGYCMGGLIAFEMAQQLRAAGEQISLLGVIDSVLPGAGRIVTPGPRWFNFFNGTGQKLRYNLTVLRGLNADERAEFWNERAFTLRRKLWRAVWKAGYDVCARLDRPLPPLLRDPLEALVQAGRRYQPAFYDNDLVVYSAKRRPKYAVVDPGLGWNGLAKRVQTVDLPGEHYQLLTEPTVSVLADHLKRMLSQKQANATGREKRAAAWV